MEGAALTTAPAEPGVTQEGKKMTIINTPNTRHLYEIGTDKGRIQVEANTRAQAANIARKAGYQVRDVNMVG